MKKIKILLLFITMFFVANFVFATGVSYEKNRENAINDLKTLTIESNVLVLQESSSDSAPTIKQYWLNQEDNSIKEEIDFAININDIGTGNNSIYYKWIKDSNDNIILQAGTSSDYGFKINYTNYTNTKQEVKTDNTTISNKFFYNSSEGTILNSATGTKISGIFANNHNSQYDQFYNGGDIINYRYKIDIIDGIFVNNYENGSTRALGAAIFNTENSVGIISTYIDDITGDFIGNYTNSSGSGSNVRSCGGAVFNYTTIENINSNFLLNHSNGISGNVEGGAIANIDIDINNMAYITNIKGDFLLNYIYANGNSTKAIGGAIVNNGYITNIEGNFIKNYIKSEYVGYGGAIYNEHDIQNINGNFTGNNINSYYSAYGGAIYNKYLISENTKIGSIDGDFINNSAISTNNVAYGGAIFNNGTITEIRGIFENNTSNSNISLAEGGAIYNTGVIGNIEGDFINNSVSGITGARGGAIRNAGTDATIKSIIGDFIGNSVTSDNSAFGGAIRNEGVIEKITGNFLNNVSSGEGGAIFNRGILNLVADTSNIEFTGNTANGISNAIFDDGGTINLWVNENKNIIFNDRINSNNTSILNINSSTTTLTADGKVVLNEDMSGYTGQVNLYGGTIKLGEKGTLFGGNMMVNNALIDMANEIIQEHNFNILTINNTLNLVVDADLQNETMDTISANDNSQINGTINVKTIKILSDSKEKETEVLFTNSETLKGKITSTTTAYSQLYKYDVVYNDGYFNFINTNVNPKINPIIFESAIAGMASGLITQVTVLNQAFSSIDSIRNRIISAKEKGFLYASMTDVVFNNGGIESGLWIRPFMSQDTISIDNLDVDNTLIGTLTGLDLAVGENSLVSFYLGYAGSNQKYEDIKISQTGYIVGATGMIIKEKWYAGLTANINFNKSESESNYGTDSFDLNMFSVGAKAGYNFEIVEKWTLEPNLTLMYGSISNQEYETTQGAKINSQSNLNIIVEPQVKAKLDLKNGWQPYALLGYVANISDNGKVVADEIEFKTDKIDGYVEYGLGANKDFINTPWNCYAQITGRNDGINGFSGNIGIKYKF